MIMATSIRITQQKTIASQRVRILAFVIATATMDATIIVMLMDIVISNFFNTNS